MTPHSTTLAALASGPSGAEVVHPGTGLSLRCWSPSSAPSAVVLALHGMTSTSAVWADLAARLAETSPHVAVVAPDLPGRGGSQLVTAGPGLSGLAASVLDLTSDLLAGTPRDVVVIGHSMGAFLAPHVAPGLDAEAPGSLRGVVLADGGVAPRPSPVTRAPVVRAVFGLATKRLCRTWSDVDAYAAVAEGDAAANRPDLLPGFRTWAEAVLDGPPGALRPRLDAERLVADAVDSLSRPSRLDLLRSVDVPVHLVAAAHGGDDQKGPFLSDSAVRTGQRVLPGLTAEQVPSNHATMLFDPALAAAVTRFLPQQPLTGACANP